MRYAKILLAAKTFFRVRGFPIGILCAAFTFVSANPSVAQPAGGPTNLIITYRCTAANRPKFREAIEKTEVDRFQKLKSSGVIEDFHLLFNWYVDEDTWDLMAILSFHTYTDVARWKEIERSLPGGLSPEALRFGAPTKTYSVDREWHENATAAEKGSHKSVFLVIPYDVVSMEEYKPYVAGYVLPQMKGWLREGILSGYSLYLNRYYAGKPWDALLVLEYKDLESLGQRDSVTAKVRAALSQDPKWKAISDNKKNIRTEKELVIADEIERR
jgi:hypothetical protein